MTKEYIDRSFVEYLIKFYGGMVTWTRKDVVNEFVKQIQAEPKADVVEVVRCKDCKHFGTDTFNRTVCVRDFQIICVKDNDFCSYGERKE